MSPVLDRLTPIAPKLVILATIIVTAILLVLSVLLGGDILRQVRTLSTASNDNMQWNLAQSEVEHLRLQAAVSKALQGGSTEAVRRNFDIFYNRISTIQESPLFANLRNNQESADTLLRIQDQLDTFVPLIDGPDDALRGRLAKIGADLVANGNNVRTMTLLGLIADTQVGDQKRKGMARTLQRLGWVVVALICALGLTALMIGRLYQRSRILTAASRAGAARMQAMVTSSLDAILLVDINGRVMAFNDAAESIFGFSRDEAVGQKLVNLIVPDHLRAQHLDGMARFVAAGNEDGTNRGRIQVEAKRKSGEIFPVELSITLSKSGNDQFFVSYLRDISDRVTAEIELTNARDDALAGERAKANLLTVMSHEMRTPLSGVLGSLELMETTKLTEKQTDYLNAMKVSGKILLHHVNAVLDLAQLEAGARSEIPHSFDLEELMSGLVDSQQATARAAGNTLVLRCHLNRAPNVWGCPRQIQQAMLNLIGNALKFTQNGSVIVDVERRGTEDQVQFLIRDTGAGIAASDLDRVFENFVTLDASYGRTSEGTGLGLAITRQIVDALGGEIEAESELGTGSLFRVTFPLPVSRMQQQEAPEKETEVKASKHILVVEDNDINRVLMTKTLQHLGHQVTTAEGGAEAVTAAAAAQFDLILMDISMPRVDGTEAFRRIRAQHLADGVDIVALTAHVAADDHARILDAGFVEVATKPISRSELSDLITRHTDLKATANTASETSDIYQFVEALGVERAQGFLRAFCHDVTKLLGELEQNPIAIPAHQSEAHRLAGSTAVLGLASLRSELLSIEEAVLGAELSIASLAQSWHEAQPMLAPHLPD